MISRVKKGGKMGGRPLVLKMVICGLFNAGVHRISTPAAFDMETLVLLYMAGMFPPPPLSFSFFFFPG